MTLRPFALILAALVAAPASAGWCTMRQQVACDAFCTGYSYANCSTREEPACWDNPHPATPGWHIICGTRTFVTCTCTITNPVGGPNKAGDDVGAVLLTAEAPEDPISILTFVEEEMPL